MANVTILDGGLGRELQRMGAPFAQPEWSALALMEAPHYVEKAHDEFVESGAKVITTNAYAVVPFHIGQERFEEKGAALCQLAAKLARKSADKGENISVAASIPPLFGSYSPALFDKLVAKEILATLIENQKEYVDLFIIETVSSIEEALFAINELKNIDKPIWLSFSIDDDLSPLAVNNVLENQTTTKLRSGELLSDALKLLPSQSISALLFNCSCAEVMENAIVEASTYYQNEEIEIGVYANSFLDQADDISANEGLSELRADLTPQRYLDFAKQWQAAGATIIGGCCGITPKHIKSLAEEL
ncbi:homocysteine S-methyltransferase family protein [Vibrio sp. SS-MA-C1-2]|uniref:homocysteine S-methyltransferase family protein n=1 Tax=Vibrio sp. SS-MA-C1-2 TaxID=2908646 RepID=UPI001F3F167D|nr:homocysteine S-methyltransferase family protein [Vibrio sp. SS-MA-C1-2]UJF17958.1 homocysteine S-methyltransferase family protein [Vibrio sp. SS-MA-C1-2]